MPTLHETAMPNHPNPEFHPMEPQTDAGKKAYADMLAERAKLEAELPVKFDADGRPHVLKPAEIVVMPKIARGSVDVRVQCSVALENLERRFGWQMLSERFALLAETHK